MQASAKIFEIECGSWSDLMAGINALKRELQSGDEEIWFRGCREAGHTLLPSLMRDTAGLSDDDHDQMEQDLFYEFQARARELRERGLSDWEYLFFARHYGLPTRVLDWTDTFGVALYFAVEEWAGDRQRSPVVWAINPYALNSQTWEHADIILPRYLGLDDTDGSYWDFGELLQGEGEWAWDGPVAVYPIQINDRVRAQRGWFTIHGNERLSLEDQFPGLVARLLIQPSCLPEIRNFLSIAGFNRFSLYPDLENLAHWLRSERLAWKQRRPTR